MARQRNEFPRERGTDVSNKKISENIAGDKSNG
jgi:hypothetical protein